ncbi:S41 family peptidase [uncultured Winogradskyella sp.]|uniref:S41 family peptidase n=1 Tax=uncultured Winogradskyella sp. TaxID=395353 RepID=UPI00262C41E3|nr:S41 family peptidase [uncultured Winogradskyella sp.]
MTTRTLILKSLIILLSFSACGQISSNQKGISNDVKIESNYLVKDLETLKLWIEKAHGDPYRFTSKEALDSQFVLAKKKVLANKQITANAFAGIVMPIIAELRDGHAQVFLPDLDKIEGNIIFPLKFIFINNKPHVISVFFKNDKVEIGSEILEINGQNVTSFFNEIIPYLHRDGNIENVRYRRLQNQIYFTKVMIALGKAKATYVLKLKTREGKIITTSISGLSQLEYNSKKSKDKASTTALTYKRIDTIESTSIIDINSFNPHYYQKGKFYQKIDSIMNIVQKDDISNLIIDLRNNNGGEDSYVMYLLRYILNDGFAMSSEVTFSQNDYKFLPDGKHWDIDPKCFKPNDKGSYDATEFLWEEYPTLGTFLPFKTRFGGKLVVLINAFTFSAASDFAAQLQFHKRATFVGEETGGSRIGNVSGYVPTLDLPNSQVKINLPLMSIKNPFFNSHFSDRGVIPDYMLELGINDILKQNDIVLKKAISLF